jgi:hypothetical protein
MTLRGNCFSGLMILFLDLENSVGKDGSIIWTQIRKGIFLVYSGVNGKKKRTKSSSGISLIMDENGVTLQNYLEIIGLNIW